MYIGAVSLATSIYCRQRLTGKAGKFPWFNPCWRMPSMADGTWPARRLPCIDSEIAATGLTLKLEEYWRSVLQNRAMPARRDIDPADLRRLLPNIFLLDVVERGTRFRWRLVGTRIGDLERGKHTGKWVQDTILHSQDPFLDFCRM